ncbi:S24 family peptidase [uncultured Hyphomonas sp.]|uniref:XRE family transcriptional regulator n=1 Tax=uncultured Hyphomonas sp. TaxID=225298 RepID=UPI000C69EDCF|nr:peptidase S24 [Hyphomonadaceae bacterium]MBA30118.1 peptidase S24 [Hyphomonadaceae bacterium]|tara:strand:+ start:36374 stop:37027 length:654 start_codon:yes stop_codon:yes gene_type:complete
MTDSAIAARLREARINAGYETVMEACEAFGFKYATYAGHENGSRGVKADSLKRYATAFRVPIEWLLTGAQTALKPSHREAITTIPIYDIRASAGPGAMAEDGEPIGYQPYRQQELSRITRTAEDNLAVIRVAGDSMEPTLANADQVLVDRSVRKVGRDGIYIIALEDDLLVKRCQVDLQTRHIIVKSDNPAYETMTVTDAERVEVLGRVIWIGRVLG